MIHNSNDCIRQEYKGGSRAMPRLKWHGRPVCVRLVTPDWSKPKKLLFHYANWPINARQLLKANLADILRCTLVSLIRHAREQHGDSFECVCAWWCSFGGVCVDGAAGCEVQLTFTRWRCIRALILSRKSADLRQWHWKSRCNYK